MAKTIVFVDDYPGFSKELAELTTGYIPNINAIYFECPIKALHYLKQDNPIDILVSDYNMPRMNGDELIEWYVTLKPNTRTVLLSGEKQTNVHGEFVLKSNLKELFDCLKRLLQE